MTGLGRLLFPTSFVIALGATGCAASKETRVEDRDLFGRFAELAFDTPQSVRIVERGGFVIMTDHGRVDPNAVLDQLIVVRYQIENDFPAIPAPSRSTTLVIFARRDAYQRYWSMVQEAIKERYGEELNLPESDGHVARGTATSLHLPDRHGVNQAYVQLGAGAHLAQRLHLRRINSWLLPALGAWYSQDPVGPRFQRAIENADLVPLRSLVSGEPIERSSINGRPRASSNGS
jgi:hypothetical protein